MLTQKEIFRQYDQVESKLNFNLKEVIQGDDNWNACRLGVITASNAYKISKGTKNETYKTYLKELVCQIKIKSAGREPVTSKYFDWGHSQEPDARRDYAFQNDYQVDLYPFIYKDLEMRVGYSPDGIIHKQSSGIEIKAPYTSKYHLDLIVNDEVKKEYFHQVQFSMFVTDCELYHFVSYDPDFEGQEIASKIFYRDEKYMDLYQEATEEAIFNMDKMLKKIGCSWGEQWK